MTFLPVVERELRVAARRRSAFWTRTAAAIIAVLFGLGTLGLAGTWMSPDEVGRSLFYSLATVAFWFCLLAGPVLTADVISQEKRDGTLGLLFLTDLRGYDVVLGKLASASVAAVFSLLAIVPVLAIPILLGGVPVGEFGRVVLALLNALFVSLALGLWVSTHSTEGRSAFAVTLLGLFVLGMAAPWLGGWLQNRLGDGLWVEVLRAMSLSATLPLAKAGAYTANAAPFWTAVVGTHLLGWFLLAWSGRWIVRAWHGQSTRRRLDRWRTRWERWNFGTSIGRRDLRRRLLERNPMLWIASRNQLRQRLLWGFVAVSLGIWLLVRWAASPFWSTWGSTLVVGLFIQSPLKWLMASEATHRWSQERHTGALELLLTTPLTVRDLLEGQVAAMRRLFLPPVLAIVAVQVLLLALGAARRPDDTALVPTLLANLVFFLWDLRVLAWLGLWFGLKQRRSDRAFLGALLRVLLVPWLVFLLVLFVVGTGDDLALPVLWVIVCGTCNWYYEATARANLRDRLRQMAAEQYQTIKRAA